MRGYWAERLRAGRDAGGVYLLVVTGAAWGLWYVPKPFHWDIWLFPPLALGPFLLWAVAGP